MKKISQAVYDRFAVRVREAIGPCDPFFCDAVIAHIIKHHGIATVGAHRGWFNRCADLAALAAMEAVTLRDKRKDP